MIIPVLREHLQKAGCEVHLWFGRKGKAAKGRPSWEVSKLRLKGQLGAESLSFDCSGTVRKPQRSAWSCT
jgi:hypothetical protein